MKRILLMLPVLLAACDARTTSPTALVGSLLPGTVSPTAVTSCQPGGLIASINVQYFACATDVNGGTGSVVFSSGGFTVALSATSGQGTPEVVASEWQSNGPVSATGQVCVAIAVTHLSLQGAGEVQEQLNLSYNGAQQAPLTWLVTDTGHKTYCGTLPAGATNVWWQLTTFVGVPMPAPTTDKGHRHLGGAKVTQTLLEAPIAP